jgi:dTMP kinase
MMFIVLEGTDGSGTTTQAGLLAEELSRITGREVVRTREPYHQDVSAWIRRWIAKPPVDHQLVLHAFALDRLLHLREVIEPALKRNAIVVSDRYKLSTMAYQTIHNDREYVARIVNNVRDPDAYVFLDVDVDTARGRMRARGQLDAYEESRTFQNKVIENYLTAINDARDQGVPVHIVPGTARVLDVHRQVVEAALDVLNLTDTQ